MRIVLSILLTALLTLANQTSAGEWKFVTEDFPPFSRSAGSPIQSSDEIQKANGPLVQIVHAVCERLHLSCPIEVHPWQRALRLAEDGEVEGIFTVARSPQRERDFHITRMLVTSRYAVFARKGNAFVYNQPGDLAGRPIGVYGPSGTSYVLAQRLDPVSAAKIHMTASNRRLLRMLNSGRFGEDALAVVNQDVAWHLIEEEQLDELREAGELATVSYGIGLSRRQISEAQFQAFEQALSALIADGTVPEILRRYKLEPAY